MEPEKLIVLASPMATELRDGEDPIDGANDGDNRENHKPCQKKVKLVINVLSSTNQK